MVNCGKYVEKRSLYGIWSVSAGMILVTHWKLNLYHHGTRTLLTRTQQCSHKSRTWAERKGHGVPAGWGRLKVNEAWDVDQSASKCQKTWEESDAKKKSMLVEKYLKNEITEYWSKSSSGTVVGRVHRNSAKEEPWVLTNWEHIYFFWFRVSFYISTHICIHHSHLALPSKLKYHQWHPSNYQVEHH